jgi:dTDP-4-amino-4,6-dideoxygalactose transaminase
MSEIGAAMGLTLLEDLDDLIARNRQNYRLYQELVSDIPGVSLVSYDEGEKSNYQYIVLEVDESVIRIGAGHLVDLLRAENVYARRYFYPGCHRMEPYRSQLDRPHRSQLPETDRVAGRVVCLPTGTAVGAAEISAICEIVRFAVREGAALRARLAERGA